MDGDTCPEVFDPAAIDPQNLPSAMGGSKRSLRPAVS
jgi:hypothetical protein